MDDISYTNIVSFVMYAMVLTHPGITYVLTIFNRFLLNLGQTH